MKARCMVGVLALSLMMLLTHRVAFAVETTFSAGATVNPTTHLEHDIREVISVTLSSPSSSWSSNDFHADNFTVTGVSYSVSRPHASGPDNLFEFGNSTIDGGGGDMGLPNGHYNCWAVAHGYFRSSGGGMATWEAGVTSVWVDISIGTP